MLPQAREGTRLAIVLIMAAASTWSCGARSELQLDERSADAAVRDARASDAAPPIDARVPEDASTVRDSALVADAAEPLACDGLPLPRIGDVTIAAVPPRMAGIGVAIPDPEGVLIVGGSTALDAPSQTMAFLDLSTAAGIDLPVIGEPIPLDRPVAVYDSARDQVVVVGGTRDSGRVAADDVFVVTGEGDPGGLRRVVTRRIAAYPPGPVHDHVAVYDPVRDRVVVHGGSGSDGDPRPFAATWVLDLSTEAWRPLLPADESPPVRAIAMGWDARRRRVIELATRPDSGDVEVHALVDEDGTDRWMRIGAIDFVPSVRGPMTWDDRACGFHLLSARRTRCTLEHWVLVVDELSVTTVMRGELALDPGHFDGSAPLSTRSNRMVLLASQRCAGRDTVASTEAAILPLVR